MVIPTLATAINLENDLLIPLAELIARRLVKRPAPATLWRWRKKGIWVGGKSVRLECVRVGGVWYSTPAAWAAFVAAQTEAAAAGHALEEPPAARTPETERLLREQRLI